MNPKIAVLIPCLNEAKTIVKVVHDFREELPEAEIHVFDNASSDDTAELAEEAGATVHLERRRGKGNVVQTMFQEVEADIYIMVDGDDTYPADTIHDLLADVVNGSADMVVGSRFMDQGSSFRWLNRLGNQVFLGTINGLFGANLSDVLSGYRVMNRRFVKGMPLLAPGFQIEVEMTIKSLERGFRVVEKPCRLRDRPEGSHSKIRKARDGWLITSYILALYGTYRPLACFGSVGMLTMAFSLGLALAGSMTAAAALGLLGLAGVMTGAALQSVGTRFRELERLIRLNTSPLQTEVRSPKSEVRDSVAV